MSLARIASPCITGGVEGRRGDQGRGGAPGKAPGPGLQGAPPVAPLSSPTALPAIFPLWLPFRLCNKSLLSRGQRARRGSYGARGLSSCPQSASRRPLAHTFYVLQSHHAEGGDTGSTWDVRLQIIVQAPQRTNLPSGLPAPSQSLLLLEGCTLIRVYSRPLVDENSVFHKFHL